MAALMTARAIAALDVVEKLPLKLGGNLLPVDDCIQVRSLESFGEFGGLFVLGAAGEMRSVVSGGARGGVRFLGGLFLRLIPFFLNPSLLRSFGLGKSKRSVIGVFTPRK